MEKKIISQPKSRWVGRWVEVNTVLWIASKNIVNSNLALSWLTTAHAAPFPSTITTKARLVFKTGLLNTVVK
jgi:hypothetical protein